MTTEEIVYSILCSVIASFFFLFAVLLLFKPKVRISPFVCKGTFTDGKEYYFIKIINVSLFSAYDVCFELLEVDMYPSANGKINDRLQPLSLVLNKVSHIPGYRPSWIRKKAPYAIRIRTAENLESILTNDYKLVKVKVSLRHGLTGLVKVHSKEYTECSEISTGKFGYGLKFGSVN